MMISRSIKKSQLLRALSLLGIFTLMLLLIIGCDDKEDKENAVETIPVEIVEVKNLLLEPTLSFSGTIEPWREASLGAQIPGQIEKIFFEIGDKVKAGEILVQMSGEQLTQAKAQFISVEKDWNRMKNLLNKGTITQQAFDRIDAAYQAAKAGYDLVLQSTRIKAPFPGVISDKYLEEGEVFTLFPGAAGSPAIVRLMLLDTIKVVISVSEVKYAEISEGQKAALTLDAFPNTKFIGAVSQIAPTLDIRSRTADVEIKFVNKENKIKPGMFGMIELSIKPRKLLVVNREALIRQEGTGIYFVYKVQGNTAVRQDVIVADNYGERVSIHDGLQAGDFVITTGKMMIGNGSQVEIKSSEVSR